VSNIYCLVSRETKQKVWIGQGWFEMTDFYTREPNTMKLLQDFLNATRGRPLEFVCEDTDEDAQEYQEFGS
jgi:hypothetical protein